MLGQERLDRSSLPNHNVDADGCQTEGVQIAGSDGASGREEAANFHLNRQVSLRIGGIAGRRVGLAVAAGLLLMAGVFQPWMGTTSSHAYPIVAENERAVFDKSARKPFVTEQKVAGTILAAPMPQVAPQPAPVEPQRVEPSSRGGDRATPDISTPEKFIAAVAVAAQDSQREDKIPASVTIAQAILESDWGKSQLSKKGQNYFGIKSKSGPGPAGVISMNTWEVIGGKDVTVKDGFKAYNNLHESIMDHGRFLKDNARYAAAFKTSDPKEFAKRIHEAGYATDPAYTGKLVKLMDKYNLYQYDLPSS